MLSPAYAGLPELALPLPTAARTCRGLHAFASVRGLRGKHSRGATARTLLGMRLWPDEREIGIVLAAPDESVEDVVYELRKRKQRYQHQFQCSNFPR